MRSLLELLESAIKKLRGIRESIVEDIIPEDNDCYECCATEQKEHSIYGITKEQSLQLIEVIETETDSITYDGIARICSLFYGFTPSRYYIAGFKKGTLATSMCVR